MRDGLEIIDTDQHVGPNMETLHKYASARLLERWDELVPYFVQVTEGHHLSIDPIPYTRELNTGTDQGLGAGSVTNDVVLCPGALVVMEQLQHERPVVHRLLGRAQR